MVTVRPSFIHYDPSAIRAAVGFEDLIEPVGLALADFSRGLGASPVAVFAPAGRDGDVHVKSAWLPDRPIFIVKVATWFRMRALGGSTPTAGIIAAFDAQTGDLRALLEDEHHLSDVRTAAAGALATRHCARSDASVLGVIGTGVQAYLQALAVTSERPVRIIRIWGRRRDRAVHLARILKNRCPQIEVIVRDSAELACREADVIVTATASSEPIVQPEWLGPGTHITAVGADDTAKCELAPASLRRADRLIVDSRALTLQFGDVARAVLGEVIKADDISAELGEVVSGALPGRAHAREITICKLIGLGVQDLVAADLVLRRLRDGRGPAAQSRPASAWDLWEG
jgi:ornithine cyclodeaminase/alanine dehydrogenase-like protein (mu-crystallin family)